MEKYNSRKEVPENYKWDLSILCKDDNEFNELYDKSLNMINSLSKYVGCTKDSDKLFEFLKLNTDTNELVDRLCVYAYLINDQELGISSNEERMSKTDDLVNSFIQNTSFFEPELLELDKNLYDKLFDNKKLDEYKSLLDKIYRAKEHIIDKDKENIVSTLENAMNNFENMSSTMLNGEHDYGTVLIDGVEEKIAPTNYRKLMKNKDRNIRREVREKYSSVLDRYGTSAAQFLNGYVKGNIAVSKIHNYKDAWDQKLFDLNMPNEAYECLRNTVEKHLDSLQRYYRLYKKCTGLDELYQYDLGLEVDKSNKEYSILEAQELCLNAVKPLGEDYLKHFKKIFDDRHIDYAQYKGKYSGGYCATAMGLPSRILMSYNYDLESVSIIIHEGGHDVHNQLLIENVPIQYSYVSTLCSEVASLTNECLLSSYLSTNGETSDIKKSGIFNILSVINSNLFGAVREAKMEQDFYNHVNRGNTITKDYMNDLTYKSLEKYYGKEVILDNYSKSSWIVRSHYYNNYYLYDYAFCISVASYIASEILSGNKDMLDKYMKFLSTGSDKWSIDAFKILGIDLTKEEVYEKAIKYYNSLLDKFEKLC